MSQASGIGACQGRRDIGVAGAVFRLAPGQLISWGTLYYAIAFLVAPIQQDTGWSPQAIFAAYTGGLLVAAMAAALVGRMLSRHGVRPLMLAGSLAAALALSVIALSHDLLEFTLGWLLAGLAMALTQYEAAFSALRAMVPQDFRRAIGWLTIVGGLASTVFWPLTHWLSDALGWRLTVLVFAGLHLVPCLLLHAGLPSGNGPPSAARSRHVAANIRHHANRVPLFLAISFAAVAFVSAAVSAQGWGILQGMGIPEGLAISVLAVIGPMQAAGRLFDLGLAKKCSVALTGAMALLALMIGLGLLACAGCHPLFLLGFPVGYGLAIGMLTVVRGSAPAEFMPEHDYASGLGAISGPPHFARALAPIAAAWLIGAWGVRVLPGILLWVAALGLAAFLLAVFSAAKSRNFEMP